MKEKRKIILIATTILIVLITLIELPKLFLNNKEEVLPEVKLKDIEKSKTFAIMVPDINGNGYIPYKDDAWPTDEEDYYYSHSECVDNKGNKIENAISFNQKDSMVLLDTNETIYCTLYFNKYNYMYVPTHNVIYDNEDHTISAPDYMSAKVKHVEFVDYIKKDLIESEKGTRWWDISDTNKSPQGSVVAWIEPIDDNYDILYIGSKAKIKAINLGYAFAASEYEKNTTNPITNFESIDFNNLLDMSKNSNELSYIFYNGKNLKKIEGIENWDTSKVRYLHATFYGCENLENINKIVSNWDVSNVESAAWAFYGCTKLTSLSGMENWNPTSIILFSYSFVNTNIVDLTPIKNWNMKHLTSTRWMFRNCSNLINADLSNWNTPALIDTHEMFYGCTNLQTIDMRNTEFTILNIYSNMFYGVPTSATIIVKDETQRSWMLNNNDNLSFSGTRNQINLPTEV